MESQPSGRVGRRTRRTERDESTDRAGSFPRTSATWNAAGLSLRRVALRAAMPGSRSFRRKNQYAVPMPDLTSDRGCRWSSAAGRKVDDLVPEPIAHRRRWAKLVSPGRSRGSPICHRGHSSADIHAAGGSGQLPSPGSTKFRLLFALSSAILIASCFVRYGPEATVFGCARSSADIRAARASIGSGSDPAKPGPTAFRCRSYFRPILT